MVVEAACASWKLPDGDAFHLRPDAEANRGSALTGTHLRTAMNFQQATTVSTTTSTAERYFLDVVEAAQTRLQAVSKTGGWSVKTTVKCTPSEDESQEGEADIRIRHVEESRESSG